jgi:hypothetical protein
MNLYMEVVDDFAGFCCNITDIVVHLHITSLSIDGTHKILIEAIISHSTCDT